MWAASEGVVCQQSLLREVAGCVLHPVVGQGHRLNAWYTGHCRHAVPVGLPICGQHTLVSGWGFGGWASCTNAKHTSLYAVVEVLEKAVEVSNL